jgi:hypothetical protein
MKYAHDSEECDQADRRLAAVRTALPWHSFTS